MPLKAAEYFADTARAEELQNEQQAVSVAHQVCVIGQYTDSWYAACCSQGLTPACKSKQVDAQQLTMRA